MTDTGHVAPTSAVPPHDLTKATASEATAADVAGAPPAKPERTAASLLQKRGAAPGTPSPARSATRGAALLRWLSFKNIGAVYVWIVLIIVFSFWAPDTFPTIITVRQVLNEQAITALMALSLVLPLASGVFDLSIGYNLGLCNVLLAWLIESKNVPVGLALVFTLMTALVIGIANATVVVKARIDSFIGTLATGSLMLAVITMIAGSTEIIGNKLSTGFFSAIANKSVSGVNLSVLYMLIVAAIIYVVLEFTVVGRWLYAAGYNPDAARLAGIPVNRLRVMVLVVSAVIAGAVAGIALTSQISSGTSTVGPPYLLNAFAAAFLGATQLRRGKFNAWGTLIAVLMLGTGSVGLGLVGAPSWAPSVFTGVVLLLALGVTRAESAGSLG